MGTNYYLYPKRPCECCGRAYDEIHIGKSSAGWCFSLHVYPENGINTLEDWQKLWNPCGSYDEAYIKDEYDKEISIGAMMDIIANRSWRTSAQDDKWYRENEAEPGPNNLARHRIDGRHCVGHGSGTYDYIVGEFS